MRLSKYHCANCDCAIHAHELRCYSSVFGSDAVLCKHCSNNEEREIDEKGTNDLPHLRKWYADKFKFCEPIDD